MTGSPFSGYRVLIVLLPCNEPPAVRIAALSPEGMELLNHTFSTSMTQGVPLPPNAELQITVNWEGRTATISVGSSL